MTDLVIEDRVSYDAPGSLEIGFTTPDNYNASSLLFDNLDRGLAEKIALYSKRGNATYGELCEQASRTGNALSALGLERGERIGLLLDDLPAYPAILFGAIRAGFVPILLNTLSPQELVKFYLEDSGARVLFVDPTTQNLVDEVLVDNTQLDVIVSVNTSGREFAGVDWYVWSDWISGFPETLNAVSTGRNDMAFWMYSSGSTGRPKGIVHLQHDMLFTAQSFGRHVLEIGQNDICFSAPKIFFAYGLGNSVIFPFSVGASAVLLEGRPVAEPIFEVLTEFRPTLFFGLPTLYNALMQSEQLANADFSSVRLCLSAAEVLSGELAQSWKEQFGLEIVEGLGSTELTHIYLSNIAGRTKSGAAGRRVPGYEVRLRDSDGNEVDQGQEGILWVRGDSSSPCYWNRPDKTEETMRDDWMWTGDRFIEDEDGFFFFQGRADDLIKVSGQWVYPLEIELCLNDNPKVKECAVLGLQMDDRRMTLKAFVVLNDGIDATDKLTVELQSFVKGELLPYKYPRLVQYLSSLPKTGTGKIDRQALARQ